MIQNSRGRDFLTEQECFCFAQGKSVAISRFSEDLAEKLVPCALPWALFVCCFENLHRDILSLVPHPNDC